jgi:butyrate kinase
MSELILTINPGTTTTRIGLFEPADAGVESVLEETIEHDEKTMASFASIPDQLDFRLEVITQFLARLPREVKLAAIAGRGGMLSPVPAGIIAVDEALVDFALHTPRHQHASNLGAPLSFRMAAKQECPAFVVDPVSVDELPAVARVSGFPEIPRFSFVHALNIRACGRRLADHFGRPFTELDLVVAHLGAGISVAALRRGRIVDNSNRMENAPFSPERAGGLPTIPLIDLCYSGKYEKHELKKRLYGHGGAYAYLGTTDIQRVEAMMAGGDARAELVWRAMLYQIAKAIGAMAAVLEFRPDAIILTGGMAQSSKIVAALTASCEALAPIHVYPGSFENIALAEGAARALAGEEIPMKWPVAPEVEPLPW